MKFVFNPQKAEEQRRMLMMQPTIAEGEELLQKDDTDGYAWYVYGKALGLNKEYDKAIEAHSQGIAFNPFYAPNYFGRGSKFSLTGRIWQAIADYTMAIQLEPSNWLYWYYRATVLNMNGMEADSIDDFRQCMKLTDPSEHYPLAYWIYTTYVGLGRFEEAEKSLDLIDATIDHPQMDYGYCRSVRLFKGMIKPEEFIDIPAMEKAVLPRENRVQLELTGMNYGLYCYWTLHGEPEKAAQAIRDLQKVAYPGAFGHTKSLPIAKRLGIIE